MNYKMKVVIEDPNTKEGMTGELMYNLDCFFVYDEEQYGKKTYLSISTEDGHFNNYYDLRYDEHYNRNEKEKYLEYWAKNYWSGKNGAWIVKKIDIIPMKEQF